MDFAESQMRFAPATIPAGAFALAHSRPGFRRIARMLELSTPVQYVKGVGPRIAEILAAKGIHTVGDLLHYLPFRYEDRLNPRGISELRAGEMASIRFALGPASDKIGRGFFQVPAQASSV